MITEKLVRQSLKEVLVPGVKRDLAILNMIRQIMVSDRIVKITLASTALSTAARDRVKTEAKAIVQKLPDVAGVDIEFVEIKPVELNQIGHIIAVMSGKGGVGKSLVASLTAVALKRQGYQVGVLDADITGSSSPRMFGVTTRPGGSNTGILPVVSRSGMEIMSMNLLLPQEDDAVIWRGPLISRAITQFWEEVVWGKLDYLVVDLPPGTADAALTVMQTLPISGIVVVFTPQDLTIMIVKKVVSMAKKMDKPVMGVVENMSYLYVPEIDKRIELFGKSRGEEMAQATETVLLGRLPIDPELAKLCDQGEIERYSSDAFAAMSQTILKTLPQVGSAEAN